MRGAHARWVGLVLILLPGACTSPPEPCPDCLVLHGVTVIDGLGNAPAPEQTIVVRDGRIEAIHASDGYMPPPEADVRDLAGRWVVPGFIDTHAHVTILPMGPDGRLADRMDRETSEAVLRTLVAFGITSVRNPAAPLEDGTALRDAVASGDLLGPTIQTSGPALNARASGSGSAGAFHDEASVRAEVRRQAEAGVDLIKVYAALPPDLVRVAIDEAHRLGVEVVGHLQRTTWTEAAGMGIDHITHGAPWSAAYLPDSLRAGYTGSLRARMDWLEEIDLDGPAVTDMIKALAEHGVTVDPTLVAYATKFIGDDPAYTQNPDSVYNAPLIRDIWRRGTFTDGWTAADYARGRAVWPAVLGLTRRLHEGGVLLAAGSDLPNPWVVPGASFHDELLLLHSAGIPPLDVLRIATHNGAVVLGLADRTGSVEVGKEADLVVLSADPVEDLANTRSIELVVLDGQPLAPAEALPFR